MEQDLPLPGQTRGELAGKGGRKAELRGAEAALEWQGREFKVILSKLIHSKVRLHEALPKNNNDQKEKITEHRRQPSP